MTQQNTTEKDHRQNRYNDAGQENRPHKKRRRRKPASEDRQYSMSRPEPATGTAAEPEPAVASQPETVQNTVPPSETVQIAASQPESAQETAEQPMESPAAAPETTMAESMDYQAAYQEIYRDILENLRSFSPSDQVACNITEEHISEYLSNSHAEKVMQFKERREKRFFAALELIAVLAAVVLVIHYLQNNSAILVNILYIIAGLGALFLWKFQPRNDDRTDNSSDTEEP